MSRLTVYYPLREIGYYLAHNSFLEQFPDMVSKFWHSGQFVPVAEMDYDLERTTHNIARDGVVSIMRNGIVTNFWSIKPPLMLGFRPLVKPVPRHGCLYGWRSISAGDVIRTADGIHTFLGPRALTDHCVIQLKDFENIKRSA